QHHAWSAPGHAMPSSFRLAFGDRSAGAGLRSWVSRVAGGETIVRDVGVLDPAARELLASGDVRSVLAVPVLAGGEWWGLVAFDDCQDARQWSGVEVDTIRILAELLGAAVARSRRLRDLTDASRIIENSPTLLYRLA